MEEMIIIGPKRAGKTTYLMALSGGFQGTEKTLGIKVEPISNDAKTLVNDTINDFLEGKPPKVTPVQTTETMPNYEFRIDIPERLIKMPSIYIKVKDYAGGIFEDLAKQPTPENLKNYLKQFSQRKKWLLLLNDWEPIALNSTERSIDEQYSRSLTTLLDEMSKDLEDFRLAVVLGKCERGELWPGRLDPEWDIFKIRLPKTYAKLKEKFRLCPNNLKFFACSAFGVLDPKTPLPNRKNSITGSYRNAVIRDTDKWQPYGLITPLVWLEQQKLWKWSHL